MTDDTMAQPTDSPEARAWAELARLTAAPGGPGASWRWSIPARPDRDSDLILSAGLQDLRDRLDAVGRLCDEAEYHATRWHDPLPVPEWVNRVRYVIAGNAEAGR